MARTATILGLLAIVGAGLAFTRPGQLDQWQPKRSPNYELAPTSAPRTRTTQTPAEPRKTAPVRQVANSSYGYDDEEPIRPARTYRPRREVEEVDFDPDMEFQEERPRREMLQPIEVVSHSSPAGCSSCGSNRCNGGCQPTYSSGSSRRICDPPSCDRGCNREPCPCPSDEVLSYYRCNHYGYYPTFWRSWPKGWLTHRPQIDTSGHDRFKGDPPAPARKKSGSDDADAEDEDEMGVDKDLQNILRDARRTTPDKKNDSQFKPKAGKEEKPAPRTRKEPPKLDGQGSYQPRGAYPSGQSATATRRSLYDTRKVNYSESSR